MFDDRQAVADLDREGGIPVHGENGRSAQLLRAFAIAAGPRIVTIGSDLDSYSWANRAQIEWGLKAYRQNGWVYGAVSQVAQDISQLPFKIRTGPADDAPEVESGRLFDLLHGNPLMGFSDVMEATVTYLELAGRACIALDPLSQNSGAPPRELWPLRPDWVTPKRDVRKVLAYWEIKIGGAVRNLPLNRLATVRYLDPKDPIMGGLSALVPSELAVRLMIDGGVFNEGYFKHGCMPGLVGTVKPPATMTEPQVARFREMVKNEMEGVKNAFKFLLLQGDITVQDFSASHKDMAFGQLMDAYRREFFSALGVPPGVAGDLSEAHLARFEIEQKRYWTDKAVPLARRLEAMINRSIVPEVEPGRFFRYDFSEVEPLQESLETRQKREVLDLEHGLKTPNEILEARGEDGYEGGDLHYIVANLVPVEDRPDPSQAPAPPPPEPAPPSRTTDPEVERQARADEICRQREMEREAKWRGFDRSLRTAEAQLSQVWRKFLQSLSDRVARQVRSRPPSVLAPERAEGRGGELPDPPDSYLPSADDLLREITHPQGRVYQQIVIRFGEAAVLEITDGLAFDPGTQRMIELVQRNRERITEEVARLLDELRDVLNAGLNEGEAIGGLIDRIKSTVAASAETPSRGGPSVRSERIARTEALAAANSGTFEGYRQGGVERHEWLSSRDALVRETHREADGQEVAVGEHFFVGGAALLFPGDPDGPAEEVIQCRCGLLPVVAEEEAAA